MNELNAEETKIIKIPRKTFKFLCWLVKQDVTLPATLVHYLKWNSYTEKETKEHLHALNQACIKTTP